MLKSMTGYGEAQAEADRFVLSIEVKSVNNRFLKVSSKLPEEITYLQNELEDRIRKRVVRGSVFFTVHFESKDTSDLYEIDEAVLLKYLRSLETLKKELNITETIDLKDLLLLPGVVHGEEVLNLGKNEVLPTALEVMDRALSKMIRMRELEGKHLEADLNVRKKRVEEVLQRIKTVMPQAIAEYHKKLDQRVRQLLGEQQVNLAPEDILKEVAIMAERSDISEEIARMDSHILQFSGAMKSDQPVGRKLEFIVQEMFRESNTMGAKAANGDLSLHVVEMKAEVDRMKEQVLNIE